METHIKKKDSYVFGPVPSRRLGRSLGIDLVPAKTCTYDCVYCQIGRTTQKTAERKNWISVEIIIAELKEKLSTKPDYITLSGSGEPTLNANCDRLIDEIKKITSIPVAVITNGSLLFKPEVRRALLKADVVLPSLDAGDEQTFKKINRPCSEITFDKMLQGLIDFRKEFKGRYWLEVFLVAGLNDSDEQIAKIADCIAKIKPDKVQLNTVSRPPAEDVKPLSRERLEQIAKKIYRNTEVIADFKAEQTIEKTDIDCDEIITMLLRRPCSLEDIVAGLKIRKIVAVKCIEELIRSGRIEPSKQGDRVFYKVVKDDSASD